MRWGALVGAVLIGLILPSSGAASSLHASFANAPDGPLPTNASTGQPWFGYGGTENVEAEVKAGSYTTQFAEPVAAAYYLEANLRAPIVSMGGEFAFKGAANRAGCFSVNAWTGRLDTLPVKRDSPLHFTVSPRSWNFGVFLGGQFHEFAHGSFSSPLPTDGRTMERIEASLSGQSVRLLLPKPSHGKAAQMTVRIPPELAGKVQRLRASWASFELYYNNAETGARVLVRRVWAR